MSAASEQDRPTGRLQIDYFSDILCVWAWIAQRRIDELEKRWGDRIELHHHFVDVFGDTAGKMATTWGDRGGFAGFADHVHASAAGYEDAPVHPALWRDVRPTSSACAHLVLRAVALVASEVAMVSAAQRVRRAFFVDAVDISQLQNLLDLVAGTGVDRNALEQALDSGAAMGSLMGDYQAAAARGIRGSPSWVMNEGRQVLYGNVGYRILDANVEELMRHPEQEASWCA